MSDTLAEKPKEESVDNQLVAARRQIGTKSNVLHLLYSFGKHLSKIAIVYLFGYFNISPAWLIGPIVLTVLREEWGKEKELKRTVAKAAALSNEKDVILARVDDLPAWVFFPDIERAEWVNRILSQVWPNVNHYAKDLIKDTIEPAIQETLLMYKMSGFTFQKMRLGSIPPRVGGVKVYDKNISREEIIMDVDIFYAGDCDISFTLSGLTGGIKDFQIHGMVRVVMKPLIRTMPLVGGLQIYFLNSPTIDFNLVGVADLLDMPGLSDMLRRVIVEQVSAMMVLPNKLSIKLSDAISALTLKFPEPQGVLRVHLIEAKQLMKKDISMLGKGKSDPYAIVTLGNESFRTKTIDNSIDPKWDFWCEFPIDAISGQILNLRLMDEDDLSKKDSNLGKASVEVFGVSEKGQTDSWITLEEAKTGMVHLRMSWLELSDNLQDLKTAIAETQMLRVTSMSTAVLMVYVDSAKNLPRPGGKSGNAPPDPMFHISVGKVTKQSQVIYRTDNPVFEKEFTFLVNNPETDTLHLKFTDQKTGTDLGKLSYNLSGLLDKPGLELQHQPLQLKSSLSESKVNLSLRLRILRHPGGSIIEDAAVPLNKGDKIPTPVLPRAESFKKQDSVSTISVKSEDSINLEKPSTEPFKVEEAQLMSKPASATSTDSGLHHRQPSTTSSIGETSLGKIQLTLRYSIQRQRLVILVHQIVNLPLKDPSNIPDPYVKLYLLPERSKESKRKTETVKDNCNPIYDETFEYVMSQGELSSRQLEVTVLTQKTWKSPVMGQVIINLAELDLSSAVTAWYDLQPEMVKEKDQ